MKLDTVITSALRYWYNRMAQYGEASSRIARERRQLERAAWYARTGIVLGRA